MLTQPLRLHMMKILQGEETGRAIFSYEETAHYYREGVYFLEQGAYFFNGDGRYSGEDMSLHGEKLRLQIGDAHFNFTVTVSYFQGQDPFPHKIYFVIRRNYLTICLHGEGVDLKAGSPATIPMT